MLKLLSPIECKVVTTKIFGSKPSLAITKFRKMTTNSNPKESESHKSTLNKEEHDKFRKMAHDWWDPKGPAGGLLSMNQLRVPLIKDGLISSGRCTSSKMSPEPLSNMRILDVGCGAGLLSEPLARLGAEVIGLDAVQENIICAKEHASKDPIVDGRVSYICSTIESFLQENPDIKKFDAVVASEVIEHVDNPPHFVSTCSSLIDDGGSFFLTTINRTQRSYLGAIIAAEYVLRLLPTGTHDWNKFITPQELQHMLDSSRYTFRTRLLHGMFYFPFFDKWTWIPDTSVNYALHAVKIC